MSDSSTTAPSRTPRTARSRRKRRRIFISYRRSDSMNATGRLYERLRRRYGKQHVFKDIDSLHAGEDFAQAIQQHIAQSSVALIMIGRTWTDARDNDGKRRLDDPTDFVRREAEEAFAQEVTVVPVLVEGGRMPEAEELPESLRQLPTLNAVVVNNDPDFEAGARRLIKHLDPLLPPSMRPAVKVRRRVLSVLVTLGLLAALLRVLAPLAFPPSEPYGGPSTADDTVSALVSFPNGTGLDAWAVGTHWAAAGKDPNVLSPYGFVLHETSGQWAKVYPLGLAARTPIPILTAIAVASSGTEGWAVGDGGTLLHLTNGTWSVVSASLPVQSPSLLCVVLYASGKEGWAMGTGILLQLTGVRWSRVNGSN